MVVIISVILFQVCFDYGEHGANQNVELVANSGNEIIVDHDHSTPIVYVQTSQNSNLCQGN